MSWTKHKEKRPQSESNDCVSGKAEEGISRNKLRRNTVFEHPKDLENRASQCHSTLSRELKSANLQRKDNTTQPRAENHLNRSPLLPRQYIQVTRESDARQQVGEEHIDSACEYQLIKDLPVRDVTAREIVEILTEETKGSDCVG